MPDEHKSFTPYELIQIISLHSVETFERDFLTIRGKYAESKKIKDYNGISYDQIVDETNGKKLKAKVSQEIRSKLKVDCCYEFEGVLERQPFNFEDLNVYLCFNVTSVKNEMPSLMASKLEEKYVILQNRNAKPRHNIDDLLSGIFRKNEKPHIALMSAEDPDTKPDVYNSIGDHIDYYIPKDVPVNLTNRTQIIKKLKETEESGIFDLIVLYRGGGGMDVFEDIDIAKAIIELKTPFIAALGHTNDRPLAELVADRAFITPSALGTYLRDCAKDYLERNELKKELKNKEEWFHSQLDTKDNANADLRTNLTQALALQKTSQTEANQLKIQNANLKKKIAASNTAENTTQDFKESRFSPALIALIGLLLVIIGFVGGVGILWGYQHIFSGDSATKNSSLQKLPTNEISADPINGSPNSNNVLNKNQKNSRQK